MDPRLLEGVLMLRLVRRYGSIADAAKSVKAKRQALSKKLNRLNRNYSPALFRRRGNEIQIEEQYVELLKRYEKTFLSLDKLDSELRQHDVRFESSD